jgi:UDPglucose 6-dehydrogenase
MKISVIGTGYVGLVTGACFADMGNEVCCLDVDEAKVQELRKGSIPIFEPGLDAIVLDSLEKERLFFTTSYETAVNHGEVIFISVGTPPLDDGEADLTNVIKL